MAQWIVIDKKTNTCVGVHNHPEAPKVDRSKYDVEQHPDNTIKDEPAEKFIRKGPGVIVRRPVNEILANFPDERQKDFVQRLQAATTVAQLKALIIEMINR